MTMTSDFAQRSRARIVKARRVLAALREAGKTAAKQLAHLHAQHAADLGRVYDRLGLLADDVVDKLPEEASDGDADRAHAIQEQIHDAAAAVEEVSLAGSAVEDLGGVLGDAIGDAYALLRKAEAQISEVERLGAKLGI